MAQAYPFQYFRLGIGNTNNIVISNESYLIAGKQVGENVEKWYLNNKGSDLFQIVCYETGRLLTSSGSKVTLERNSNSPNQLWKIKGIQRDYEGYNLYYKIISNEDTSKCLTFTDGKGFSLENFTSNINQKFKLNLDGLQGFAANCKTSRGEKAGTIGGLLGNVVFVTTADDLEKELNSVGPQIIVIAANIDMQKKSNTRIRDNKTIVGSLKYHTIFDSQFRTNDAYGAENDSPSDNIVFRNLDMQAKNVKNRILINIWSSRQIWIDHINFNSNLSYNRNGDGQDDVGKFIWLNTPYDSYLDKKDRLRSPDYMTISYCKFSNRYWTVSYGTQNTEITRDRTTLLYNWWNENVRRCPQLENGTAHIYNNYYQAYGENNNGPSTAGIIGGDDSEMLSQNNMFNGYTKTQALMMGGDITNPCRDDGSYFSASLNGIPTQIGFIPKKKSSWNPNISNYGYTLINAYNNKNTDTKAFCTKYCGCFSSLLSIKYITDSDFDSWDKIIYEAPFLRNVTFKNGSNPNEDLLPSFKDGECFKIKNAHSGLYMQVEEGKAKNSANVQQWDTTSNSIHDIWKVYRNLSGYYYLISCVGDGGTYALDIKGNNSGNGVNVQIYEYTGLSNQHFIIIKNPDGSYLIKSKISGGRKAIEIENAETKSGANVQQWEANGHPCQNWFFEPVNNPGCILDTNYNYEFQNAFSGMVMDVVEGKMASGTNIQQWTSSHGKWQQWILKRFSTSNYYYIHSAYNQNFALKVNSATNGGNISLELYSKSDSSLLFKFSKNPDGTYCILTRLSKEKCLVEVENDGLDSGDNVQQWEYTNHLCQKWNLNKYTLDVNLTMSNPIVKTQVFKDNECVHTVVFMK